MVVGVLHIDVHLHVGAHLVYVIQIKEESISA